MLPSRRVMARSVVVEEGQQLAEAPDAGLVDRERAVAALCPQVAEGAGVGLVDWTEVGARVTPRVFDLVELAGVGVTKIAGNGIGRDTLAVRDASEAV